MATAAGDHGAAVWSPPWFTHRPRAAFAVAAAMFAGIFTLRLFMTDPLDAISMLYLFPVALVAMTRGRWAGLAGGMVAVLLVGIWVSLRSVDLDAIGWVSRVLPLLLVGLLIGDARDRLVRAASEHVAHLIAVQRHREAVEINDSLVQGMSAAKWSIEAGRTETGLQMLGETVELGHRLVSELIRESGAGAAAISSNGDGPSGTADGAPTDGTKVPRLDDARP